MNLQVNPPKQAEDLPEAQDQKGPMGTMARLYREGTTVARPVQDYFLTGFGCCLAFWALGCGWGWGGGRPCRELGKRLLCFERGLLVALQECGRLGGSKTCDK